MFKHEYVTIVFRENGCDKIVFKETLSYMCHKGVPYHSLKPLRGAEMKCSFCSDPLNND